MLQINPNCPHQRRPVLEKFTMMCWQTYWSSFRKCFSYFLVVGYKVKFKLIKYL